MTSDNVKEFTDPIYKQWFKTSTQSGFVSITPFVKGEKFTIEIGQTDSKNNGKLLQATNAFVDFMLLGSYLRSVTNNTSELNFVENKKNADGQWINNKSVLTVYGGGKTDKGTVARIFKSEPHEKNTSKFIWKCGHFEAKETSSGAFIPDMNKVIQRDQMQISRQDMTTISYILDLAILKEYLKNDK